VSQTRYEKLDQLTYELDSEPFNAVALSIVPTDLKPLAKEFNATVKAVNKAYAALYKAAIKALDKEQAIAYEADQALEAEREEE
jgi:hypothetical protein